MKSTLTDLGDDQVKLTVEVEESIFEKAVDEAFRQIAKEVRVPGFRPGKVPRRILEARIGTEFARSEALRNAIPGYYGEALREHEVDAIAPPEVDITAGEESGTVVFDAVVAVRPTVTIEGYADLAVKIPAPEATDDEVEDRLDRFRGGFADLVDVDRPALDGDHVLVDIHGSRDGEELAGLTADDYLYEVGSEGLVVELDENLRGAKPGDILQFGADHPSDPDATLDFRILVKAVREKKLPELTDEWVAQNSELGAVEALRADTEARITGLKRARANALLRERVADAVGALVTVDPPEPLVATTAEEALHNLAMRLHAQGISFEQWLAATGQSPESMSEQLKEQATESVRIDLALRAVATAEGLEATDAEIDEAIVATAGQLGQEADEVRHRLEHYDGLLGLKADLAKAKALDWLLERVTIVDEDTDEPIDREKLEEPEPDDDDEEAVSGEAEGPGPVLDSAQAAPTGEPDTTAEEMDA